jgi:hypothetical protein
MDHMKRIVGITLSASLILADGCATPADRPGAALAPSLAVTPETARLKGVWRGSFAQVGVGDTGQVQGDIDCKVAEDGTYTATWTTRVVAGSSRGSRMETSGTAVDTGGGVAFVEKAGGSFTLKHSGNTLYGIRRDPVSGRTIAVQLERVSAEN